MKAPTRVDVIDKLITSFREIIQHEEQIVALIEGGVYFHRNNIVDVTAETMIASQKTLSTLRFGIKELERSRADIIK